MVASTSMNLNHLFYDVTLHSMAWYAEFTKKMLADKIRNFKFFNCSEAVFANPDVFRIIKQGINLHYSSIIATYYWNLPYKGSIA
jgi:hypothetical protein